MAAHTMIYMEMAQTLGDMAKLPEVQAQLKQQADAVVSPWYREFLRYDPSADIAKVNKPWLALNGAKDMQVLAANLEAIKKLNPAADTVLLADLNHLFLPATTGSPAEYATITAPISPTALNAITTWLNQICLISRNDLGESTPLHNRYMLLNN